MLEIKSQQDLISQPDLFALGNPSKFKLQALWSGSFKEIYVGSYKLDVHDDTLTDVGGCDDVSHSFAPCMRNYNLLLKTSLLKSSFLAGLSSLETLYS